MPRVIAQPSYLTYEDRWNAVLRRDSRADGSFLYAVKTTGVFCRPTCPSRLPNRVNVEFFSTYEQAESSGYRACKKCRPSSTSREIPDAVLLACRLIEEAEESPSLESLADAAGLSPFYFHKLFKRVVGVTPKAFATARRSERFRERLKSEPTVTRAIYEAGFGSSSRCYEKAGDNLGMTPTEYRGGGAGKLIRFAIVECRLGWAAVAATERGVCMIELGDSPASLRKRAASLFPKATLHDGDDEFRRWIELVVEQLDSPRRSTEIPLDIEGTAFQHKVWEALREIPAGKTLTYTEVARKIGRPAAVRAVANACAANQVAVAIPCHRVVRSDGGLGGYRWGIERKRKLLEHEVDRSNEVER